MGKAKMANPAGGGKPQGRPGNDGLYVIGCPRQYQEQDDPDETVRPAVDVAGLIHQTAQSKAFIVALIGLTAASIPARRTVG
jgi:hypothetical protein